MKIDVAGKELTWENEKIVKEIKSRGIECQFVELTKLSYDYTSGVKVYYDSKLYKLPDLVLCRGGFTRDTDFEGNLFVRTLEMLGVTIVDKPEGIFSGKYKAHTTALLVKNGIGHPKSLLVSSKKDLSRIDFSPVVVKPLRGSKGEGIYKVDKLTEVPEGEVLVQELISNSNQDTRVHVIGGRVVGAMLRKGASDEWRSNIALGGSAEIVEPTKEMAQMAVKATEVCGLDITGVDILTDSKGKNYVIEVNRTPQFKGFVEAGVDYPKILVDYLVKRI